MQFMDAEDKRSRCGTGECVLHLAQSKTPSTRRRSSYGTWEASSPPRAASLGRVRKGNTEIVPRTVARSRTTSYYRRSPRTMVGEGRRRGWREGR
jgi:hypothetical protein